MKIYYDKDSKKTTLKGKKIAIIGYQSLINQGYVFYVQLYFNGCCSRKGINPLFIRATFSTPLQIRAVR